MCLLAHWYIVGITFGLVFSASNLNKISSMYIVIPTDSNYQCHKKRKDLRNGLQLEAQISSRDKRIVPN
jgi:hypothetical protein